MNGLFIFAIGVRLATFMIFVACVYRGNVLFTQLEGRKTKLFWKISFVTLYSLFPPCNLCSLVGILLWFKCIYALLMLGHFVWDKENSHVPAFVV